MKVSSLATAAIAAMLPSNVYGQDGNTCLMIYQMADNDLEFFIRQDNTELSESQLVRNPGVTTWIYFDHRNLGEGRREDIPIPLSSVYNSDGSEVSEKTELSQYFRWDHSLDKMVIDRTLPGEQNSDTPEVLTAWATVALEDCVSKGATSFMIDFSSHGGGFDGFGGDDNPGRRRKLFQSNTDIVNALQDALDAVDGAPEKFDVVGFDACYMSAFGAADNYLNVGKYLLASEPVEPGHGWAYNALTDGSSAFNLAKEIQATYLSEMQGRFHDNPKILAMTDLEKYKTFLSDWDALSAEMTHLLDEQDPDFYAQLARARSAALSFEHTTDLPDTQVGSALDIGHFLKTFRSFCGPSETSELRTLMDSAEFSYNEMFVVRGSGEGTTKKATGMHITWPTKTSYVGDEEYLDPRLYEEPYATTDAPNWLAFLVSTSEITHTHKYIPIYIYIYIYMEREREREQRKKRIVPETNASHFKLFSSSSYFVYNRKHTMHLRPRQHQTKRFVPLRRRHVKILNQVNSSSILVSQACSRTARIQLDIQPFGIVISSCLKTLMVPWMLFLHLIMGRESRRSLFFTSLPN